MNLVIISGDLAPICKENIYTLKDGTIVYDSYLVKKYMIRNEEKETRLYFTAHGKKAQFLLDNYQGGDQLLIQGKLASRQDETGHIYLTIVANNIARYSKPEYDSETVYF